MGFLGRAALAAAVLAGGLSHADYSRAPDAADFVQRMVEVHGFDARQVRELLGQAQRQDSILEAIARPAEKTKPWKDYRKIFVTDARIEQGVSFWRDYAATLERAEQTYGVPADMIVAIIGVETFYGRFRGNHRVLDALATLGFDYPPRAPFFKRELEEYLLLVREQGFDPQAPRGSYAGAMGYGQFIPSSYRHYAVDFDGDGVVDLLENPVDAIGSVANYFRRHGWQTGRDVVIAATRGASFDAAILQAGPKPTLDAAQLRSAGVVPARPLAADERALAVSLEAEQGEQLWLGLQNFYVITRYNRSPLYAMAAYDLSQALRARYPR
ncbi:MAG TPA: lytic murein transglycosylase B [Spongiibacteraceae bacterium]|jgi:membrane-bound lytic murein transglycosylase B|nr:lytic murein transglycosylase B [Spongiibacteraceae bacterium]HUH37819.1 lytic murein transglycosylase B [Spongiibacteraceae bacterium]